MSTKYLIFITLTILLSFSCRKNKNNTNDDNPLLTFNVCDWDRRSVIPLKIIKEIRFLPLETTKENLIGKIDKILFFDDKIYVLDRDYRKDILIFDSQGKYIGKVGKYGRGAGEFVRMTDFNIDKESNQLVILDSNVHKLIFYDLSDGSFVKEYKLDFWASNFLIKDKQNFIFYSKRQYTNENHLIAFQNLQDKSRKWFIKQDEYDANLGPLFSIFQSKNNYFTSYMRDVVYQITEKEVVPYAKFDFGQQKLPSDRLKNIHRTDAREYIKLFEENNWTLGIENFLESDNFIAFNLELKGTNTCAVYSKKTKQYKYGNHFDPPLNRLQLLKFIAVNQNEFITPMDAVSFLKMKDDMEKNKSFYIRFPEGKKITTESNPIILFFKFNPF